MAKSQAAVGITERVSGPLLFVLLALIAPVGHWYFQNELNKVWAAQGDGGAPPA